MPALAVMYLLTVFIPARGPSDPKMTPGTVRQLRTLATAVDLLCKGKVLQAMDILVQRMKALEMSVTDGGWANAQWLELLPRAVVSMTGEGEQQLAAHEEEREQKKRKLLADNLGRGKATGANSLVDEETAGGQAQISRRQQRRQDWWANRGAFGRGGGFSPIPKKKAHLSPGPGGKWNQQ